MPRHPPPSSPWLLAAALAFATLAGSAAAAAQGTCSCNNGCHMYPAQCIHGAASGCDPGYAPFCGSRGGTCPHTGWVSCDGSCVCTQIPGYDAGVPDAGAPPDVPATTDVPLAPDVPVTADAPYTPDAPAAMDVPFTPDAPTSTDAPLTPRDAPPGADVPVPPRDAPTSTDAPLTPRDAPPGADVPVPPADVPPGADVPASFPDAAPGADVPSGADASTGTDVPPGADVPPCACPGGVCIDGRCITARCRYQQELGFICDEPGTACRSIDGVGYCVPLCLGESCAAGEFCDPRAGGACVRDDCATRRCPVGLSCYHNQCGHFGDGGEFAPLDDASVGSDSPSDGSAPRAGVDNGGCGCRATAPARPGGAVMALAAALALLARRRRR